MTVINTMKDEFSWTVLKVFAENNALGALDIETTVVENPWADPPQLVSVAVTFDGDHAFVFSADNVERARPILENNPFIMHNGLFDRLMLKEFFDLDVKLKHDTMAMQYLLDPDEPKGLEDLSTKYLELAKYKDVDYKNILDEPWEKVAEMNAADTCNTYNLFRPLGDQLNADTALSRVYQWILMPAINELIKITQNGIPLNGERLAELTERTEKEVEGLLTDLREATPLPGEDRYPKGWPKPSWWRVKTHGKYEGDLFNPGSWQQVGHVLFELWGLTPIVWNENEEGDPTTPSTNADVLLTIETYEAQDNQQEWLRKLREYRKATKLLSYFHSWPNLVDDKGWLHPRYRPLRVVTGRLSSDSPNIQQVPRKKEVRACFGDATGFKWMKADYSQIELRLAALAAEEETMLEAYHAGEDLHRLTARLVLGDDSDEARQVGKTLNFGLLYGAGPATLQRVARADYNVFITLEEARQYKEDFFRAYPGLAGWHARCEAEITATGISRTPLGRIRYLPYAKIPSSVQDMWSKKMGAVREGINHRIQGYASDLLLGVLPEVASRVKEHGAFVIAEVHDEIDLLVDEDFVSQVAAIVQETMEDTTWLAKHGIKLGIPLLAEVETGPNWGDLLPLPTWR